MGREPDKRTMEIGDQREEYLKNETMDPSEELKGVLEEHAFTEEPISDKNTPIFNRIKKRSGKTIPLSYCEGEGEDVPAFMMERVFDYYVLHVRLKGILVVREDKKGIYKYLAELKEKEEKNEIEYELKAAEAFENFDMIYDKLGNHNITKEEILEEMRSER